jgi:hypothetical protein
MLRCSEYDKEELRPMVRLSVLCGILFFSAAIAPAQQDLTLQVQLQYKGTGTVDATHKIYVAIWDSADFGSAPPTDVKSATLKNGVVTFTNLKKTPAYVSAAYDPTGHWDGASGPPPTGSSLGMYSKAPPTPDPIAITPGKIAKVTISFDDSIKVP